MNSWRRPVVVNMTDPALVHWEWSDFSDFPKKAIDVGGASFDEVTSRGNCNVTRDTLTEKDIPGKRANGGDPDGCEWWVHTRACTPRGLSCIAIGAGVAAIVVLPIRCETWMCGRVGVRCASRTPRAKVGHDITSAPLSRARTHLSSRRLPFSSHLCLSSRCYVVCNMSRAGTICSQHTQI